MTDHAAAALELLPVAGLPEFRPGDDLAAAIAAAAPWLRDGDVVVITSKIVSKVEGRLVRVPADPEERDRIRREHVDAESVRVLARKMRTLITENKLGIVQAASGVDASNVAGDEIALLPVDPDGTAAALRGALKNLLGVEGRLQREKSRRPPAAASERLATAGMVWRAAEAVQSELPWGPRAVAASRGEEASEARRSEAAERPQALAPRPPRPVPAEETAGRLAKPQPRQGALPASGGRTRLADVAAAVAGRSSRPRPAAGRPRRVPGWVPLARAALAESLRGAPPRGRA